MAVTNGGHHGAPIPHGSPAADGAASISTPKKLHGRAFYESLGSPRFVLAPMVDQSEFAWRLLTRSFMAPSESKNLLAYTPMLHARMFAETPKFRDHHFQPLRAGLTDKPTLTSTLYPPSQWYLDGHPTLDRPLVVQFCANDPQELLEAASYVAPFCDAVDLNLGCPQGIARKGHYGAFLQEDQDLVYKLIHTLHANLSVPVTAKIRILETREATLAYAKKVLSAGASILTVHGRQREQKGHKTGLADWTMLRYLREHLPKDTVLFANGNILRSEDIGRCLEATGADAVMSAEGNLHDPAIFATPPAPGQEGREYWRGRDGKGGFRMDAVFRRYMDILYEHVLAVAPPSRTPLFLPSDPVTGVNEVEKTAAEAGGQEDDEAEERPHKRQKHGDGDRKKKKEKTSSPNLLAMQPHLFRLLRPLVAHHHHVRDALARCRAGDVAAFEAVLQMVEVVVRDALVAYERGEEDVDGEGEKPVGNQQGGQVGEEDGEEEDTKQKMESSKRTVRECKRPWWICQPYVRPLPAEAFAKGSLTLSRKELAKMNGSRVMEEKEEKEVGVEIGKDEVLKGVVTGREEEGLVCG